MVEVFKSKVLPQASATGLFYLKIFCTECNLNSRYYPVQFQEFLLILRRFCFFLLPSSSDLFPFLFGHGCGCYSIVYLWGVIEITQTIPPTLLCLPDFAKIFHGAHLNLQVSIQSSSFTPPSKHRRCPVFVMFFYSVFLEITVFHHKPKFDFEVLFIVPSKCFQSSKKPQEIFFRHEAPDIFKAFQSLPPPQIFNHHQPLSSSVL